MGDIAQLPVNKERYKEIDFGVSMGDIAQLPVNAPYGYMVADNGFNGRHCPTPCQLGIRAR